MHQRARNNVSSCHKRRPVHRMSDDLHEAGNLLHAADSIGAVHDLSPGGLDRVQRSGLSHSLCDSGRQLFPGLPDRRLWNRGGLCSGRVFAGRVCSGLRIGDAGLALVLLVRRCDDHARPARQHNPKPYADAQSDAHSESRSCPRRNDFAGA